ncbi:excinuclease ABC subunit C [Leifsonia xyli subsp. cynodontis DSM 46306]|uniref:Uncharacterized protein n=1 Tax=Leifsonia xyli subsp. cynodontis DSM 46306 TaxID=1389489 RepID=U3P8W6_LEIXC|nr:excinuclease ABC subunit C [Leifsonia xyli subsp. cynodontis DSM 46306]
MGDESVVFAELDQIGQLLGPSRRPATSEGWMPWMRTFHSWNSSCPVGGWMSHPARSTTRPCLTLTNPTEHADAAEEFAVSKSIAVKSRVTPTSSHAPPTSARGATGAP